jgi:hypothetical protein
MGMTDNTPPMREPRPKKRYQWQDLQGLVSPAILSAPRLDWERMDRRYFQYLIRTVHGDQAPWFEHLVLLTAILEMYIGLDPSSIAGRLHSLHGRWRALFPAYGLTTFAQWNPEEHLPRYLQDTHFCDSLTMRDDFFRNYTVAAEHSQAYWRALPQAEQAIYRQWMLPLVPKYITKHYSRRAEILEIQKARRKREADAITPHLSKIRGEAHLRWNKLKRLHTTFQETLALVQSGQETVPLAFSYEEPGSGQRLHFVLWDRPRFVLAHQQYYQERTIFRAKQQIRQQNRKPFFYFLEFVKTESLPQPKTAVASDEGPLWFGDLLRYGLLRDGPFRGEPEELQRQRSYLESWGYVSESEEIARAPLLRLVPKGSDKLADYFVGAETQRNFEKTVQLLKEHYHLAPGDRLPSVPFDPNNGRAHRFPARPYLFQFNGHHLTDWAVTACMRFLCHGLVFQTRDGQVVPLKAHTLRHVFATHAHHVEHLPLDVVAIMLHQKNLEVTGYYAAPQWEQVVTATDLLLDRFATHLGEVGEILVRTPAELHQQYESARQQVGTLTRVIGGECTCHALCPVSFACTGCVYKVPDPARREEIVEQRQWAMVRLEQVKRRRVGPEIVKMQALLQRCDAELEEMTLVEHYRKDELYDPTISIGHQA